MDKNLGELKTEFEELNSALDDLVSSGNAYKAATEKITDVTTALSKCQVYQDEILKETKEANSANKQLLQQVEGKLNEFNTKLSGLKSETEDSFNKISNDEKQIVEKLDTTNATLGTVNEEVSNIKTELIDLKSKLKTAIIIAASSLGTAIVSIIIAIIN